MSLKNKHLIKMFILFAAGFFLFNSCSRKSNKITEKVPSRIVVLNPSGAEILCAVGAFNQIAARSDFCNYPQCMCEKKSAGGFSETDLSIESIMSFEPDFVYGSSGIHDNIAVQLKSLGVDIYLSEASSIESIFKEIKYISEITGHSEKGFDVISEIKERLKEVENKNIRKPVNVYYEIWDSPYMSAGSLSYINDLIKAAGGNNIFSDIISDYTIVSEEAIFARKPEVIIVSKDSGNTLNGIIARSGWNSIPAVQNRKIYFVDSDLFNRPGPRIVDAVQELNSLLCR